MSESSSSRQEGNAAEIAGYAHCRLLASMFAGVVTKALSEKFENRIRKVSLDD